MSAQERDEVLSDIRSHIAEATAAGSQLDHVLTSLGPADQLARAYAVELLLNPAVGRPEMSVFQRFFALASFLALTSIPTLIIVTTFGAIGASLLCSGAVVFLAGRAEWRGSGSTTLRGRRASGTRRCDRSPVSGRWRGVALGAVLLSTLARAHGAAYATRNLLTPRDNLSERSGGRPAHLLEEHQIGVAKGVSDP